MNQPDEINRHIHRSHSRDIVGRLFGLQNVFVTPLTQLQYGDHCYNLCAAEYPALNDSLSENRTKERLIPTILISGGVHGDEPAGVYAAMDFLEHHAREYDGQCNFVVIPCVNPSGFELDTRANWNEVDLNREFGTGGAQQEVQAIEEWLAYKRWSFAMTLDLHEDPPYRTKEDIAAGQTVAPNACYLYETQEDRKKRIGRALIEALPPDAEVCQFPTLYQDINDRGVMNYPEANRNPVYAQGTTFEAYLRQHFTDHTLTFETPTIWPLSKRVAVHLTWIRTAIRLILAEDRGTCTQTKSK